MWGIQSGFQLLLFQNVHGNSSNGSAYYDGKIGTYQEETEEFTGANSTESPHESGRTDFLFSGGASSDPEKANL